MIIALFTTLVASCAAWLLGKQIMHWRRQAPLYNIPGPPSVSLLTGNLGQAFDLHGWKFHANIVAQYGKVIRLNGLLRDRLLYISDTKALQSILIKDQHVFEPSPIFIEVNKLLFGEGLISTIGDHHRRQRKLLNPLFSTTHMRHIMPIFVRVAHQFREVLVEMAREGEGQVEIDFFAWMSRAALEIVGQAGLGHPFDSLNTEVEDEYGKSISNLSPTMGRPGMVIGAQLLPWLIKIGSPNFRRFLVNHLPWRSMEKLSEIVDIMDNTARRVLESKKAALDMGDEAVLQRVGEGKDILSTLLRANMSCSAENRLPDSEIVAQISIMIVGAVESTSSALSRILLLLAEHQDIQRKLRLELTTAISTGDLDFDALHTLPYLDAVIKETLRLYPPGPYVGRMQVMSLQDDATEVTSIPCSSRSDYTVPLGTPIIGIDGQKLSEIFIPNNTDIVVSIVGVNQDPDIWGPDAAEWQPKRWLSPLSPNVAEARIPGVYANIMTFVGGIHACIGFKFAEQEIKVILAILLPSFHVSLSNERISWTMKAFSAPVVEGSSQPTMPLVLSLLRSDDDV